MAGGGRRYSNRDQALNRLSSVALTRDSRPSPFIRVALGQLSLENSVVSINVFKKVDVSILSDNRCVINDQHRNRGSEIDFYVIGALVHGILHSWKIPAGKIAQQPLRRVGLVPELECNHG